MKVSQITNKNIKRIIWINRIQFMLVLVYTGLILPLNDLNRSVYNYNQAYTFSALGIVFILFTFYFLIFEYDYFFFEVMPFLLLFTLFIGNSIPEYFTDPNAINILRYSTILFVIILVTQVLVVSIIFFVENSSKNLMMSLSEIFYSHKGTNKFTKDKWLETLPLALLFFLPMVSTDFLASNTSLTTTLSSIEAHTLLQYNSYSYNFANFIGTAYIIPGTFVFHIILELVLLMAVVLTLLPIKNTKWRISLFIIGIAIIISFLINLNSNFLIIVFMLISIWLLPLLAQINIKFDANTKTKDRLHFPTLIGITFVCIGIFYFLATLQTILPYPISGYSTAYTSYLTIFSTLIASTWLFMPAIVLYFSRYNKHFEHDAYVLAFIALSVLVILYFAQFFLPFGITEFTCTLPAGFSGCITSFRPTLLIFIIPILAVKITSIKSSTPGPNRDTNTTGDLTKVASEKTL